MQVQFPAGQARKTVDVDAAIVDLDGTMVDTIGDFAEAITRMLADLQLPALPATEVEHMVGKGTEHLLRSVL
ncbi:MAG: phosphoglycolate phosphatase, partial [Comamonas sp.]